MLMWLTTLSYRWPLQDSWCHSTLYYPDRNTSAPKAPFWNSHIVNTLIQLIHLMLFDTAHPPLHISDIETFENVKYAANQLHSLYSGSLCISYTKMQTYVYNTTMNMTVIIEEQVNTCNYLAWFHKLIPLMIRQIYWMWQPSFLLF